MEDTSPLSSFLAPPSHVYVFGTKIGPRPLVILDQSQPVEDVRGWEEALEEEKLLPTGMQKYEPLLSQLQWEHGVIYIPLPVPSHLLSSIPREERENKEELKKQEQEEEEEKKKDNQSENGNVEKGEWKATGKMVEEDIIGASCERVRMTMDMLGIRWTHFLGYSFGALVAARMAASPILPTSTPFPLSTFAAAPSSTYAHRIGTILLLDTPLVTNDLLDNIHRRRVLYFGALDFNLPPRVLEAMKEMVYENLEPPLPTPCLADRALYKEYLFDPKYTFPLSSTALSSLHVFTTEGEGMQALMEEENEGKEDVVEVQGKTVNEKKGKEPRRGLYRWDKRYIPLGNFLKEYGHPMELITPAEGGVAEVDVFKRIFGMSRRTAVIKSATREKCGLATYPEGGRREAEQRSSSAKGTATDSTEGGEKKKNNIIIINKKKEGLEGRRDGVLSGKKETNATKRSEGNPEVHRAEELVVSPLLQESLLFECIKREAVEQSRGCSSSPGRSTEITPSTGATGEFERGDGDGRKQGTEEGALGSSTPTGAGAGSSSSPRGVVNSTNSMDGEKGGAGGNPTTTTNTTSGSNSRGSVISELAHTIRSWLRRFEPDDYISQQFFQRAKEMKQLLDSGSSTGGEVSKKSKELSKDKKKKDKKNKK